MAQGDPRARHSRHASRIIKSANSGGSNLKVERSGEKLEPDDEETVVFIKRVLCVSGAQNGSANESTVRDLESKSLDELLPPLTSSNEVDIQLYAIIAVILNQFVRSWYNRITPDGEFIGEIIKIIAHCTRGIEQRLRQVDLETLLLDELPALIASHIDVVTIARDACSNDRSQDEVRIVYQSIRPNRALMPPPDSPANISEQLENETAWSQLLISRILPLVLPPEDLQNPCLHVLVSEIFSEMIIRNAICGKGSEAWVIWEGATKLIHSTLRKRPNQQPLEGDTATSINKLEQFGLLSSAEPIQHADRGNAPQGWTTAVIQSLWTVLHLVSLLWLLLRFLARALMHESSIPARSHPARGTKPSEKLSVTAHHAGSRPSPQESLDEDTIARPVVSMRVWSLISRLSSLDHRMPWLFGFLSLLRWLSLYGPGKVCRTNGVFDRLVSSEIGKGVSRPELLPRILSAVRSALFPDNALAPTRQTPTSAEAAEIKRECARTIVETVPRQIRSHYFATKDLDLMRQDVETTLDLFADSYINKHLIVSALELLVTRVFPELGDDIVEE